MAIEGIDEVTFACSDLATCRRFFLDWGLSLREDGGTRLVFETLNRCRVIVAHPAVEDLAPGIESDPTLRQVVWGVEAEQDFETLRQTMRDRPGFVETPSRIGCNDPNGMRVLFELTCKQQIELHGARYNTWDRRERIDNPAPIYERATPIEIGHAVFFVADVAASESFYASLGFVASDRYPGRGVFMRCAQRGGHHDLFLLQGQDGRRGLNHLAFTVRDIHEVFGGGLHISRCGWDTQLGPGRHPISSAYFWYFRNPAGALVEYYADEDELTAKWVPREFEPESSVFAEWAIDGGLDGRTRRQKGRGAQSGFLTDKQ